MKNIIVFGATGGIGAYTVLHLHDTGKYNVIAVGHRKMIMDSLSNMESLIIVWIFLTINLLMFFQRQK